jgi:hypothetical protein
MHLLEKKIMKWTIFGHSNTIYNSMYKRKYGLEEKEIAFQYIYGALQPFPYEFECWVLCCREREQICQGGGMWGEGM